MATKGYASPEAAAIYTRARDLALVTGQTQDIGPVLFGIYLFNLVPVITRSLKTSRRSCLTWRSGSRIRGLGVSGTLRWASV